VNIADATVRLQETRFLRADGAMVVEMRIIDGGHPVLPRLTLAYSAVYTKSC
jgi:hypothetical protein